MRPNAVLRRVCACGGTPGPDGECAACKARRLGRKAAGTTPRLAPPIVHEVLRSPGRPLDTATRDAMEPRFGHNFASVRIHTDVRAAESARAVGAVAYTVGPSIVFDGSYAPTTTTGAELLAHELAHVVQQTGSGPQPNLLVGRHDDPEERAADSMAAAALVDGTPVIPPRSNRVIRRQGGGATQQGSESGSCDDVQLCFLPLEVLVDAGVPPGLAYLAAVHAYIKWGGDSAGFTRLAGEKISDARVIHPEPRVGQPHERCVHTKLRTVPTPTLPQVLGFLATAPFGLGLASSSYPEELAQGLHYCSHPSCALSRARLRNVLVDDRRGLYSLLDENCETWARRVLSAACLDAPEVPWGGEGNFILRIWQETPGGNLYHLARVLLGRTRDMPTPTPR
jgi:hypothetical protein